MKIKIIPFGDKNYLVSEDGKIYNGDSGKELKPSVSKSTGYMKVVLYQKNGKRKDFNVHRLVANAFVCGHGEEVNHINGNKRDNRAKNLEWCTRDENLEHAYKTGLMPNNTVSKKVVAKNLGTGEEILFCSIYQAAKNLSISKGNICMCCKGIRPSASGYLFSYFNGGGE